MTETALPFYIILIPDRGGALPDRVAHRQEHLDYWAGKPGVVKVAGAMLGDDGPAGSAFLLEAGDEAAVRELIAGDPFSIRGIFSGDAVVTAIRPAIGDWLPS